MLLLTERTQSAMCKFTFKTTSSIELLTNAGYRDQLMRWFDPSTGLWRTYWWQGASILTSFNDIAYLDESVKNDYGSTWESVFNNAPSNRPYKAKKAKRDSGFLNDLYDDEGWWALAWIGAYDNTGKTEYLDEAIAIWSDINEAFNRPTCGGVPWKKDEGSGPVSIANCMCHREYHVKCIKLTGVLALYINAAASLAARVGDDQKGTYLDAALDGWAWFQQAELINSDNLVNDGVGDDCKNANDEIFTYNQGSIIGALIELASATDDDSYLDTATDIANAVIADGSPLLTDDGILADGCDLDESCTGGDGSAFKGVFIRNLRKLNNERPTDEWKAFMEKNAQSIWNNNLQITDGGCRNGLYWSGPYIDADEPVAQAVALDGITAALVATL